MGTQRENFRVTANAGILQWVELTGFVGCHGERMKKEEGMRECEFKMTQATPLKVEGMLMWY